MNYQFVSAYLLAVLILCISVVFLFKSVLFPRGTLTTEVSHELSPEATELVEDLASSLPKDIILLRADGSYRQATRAYWAQQAYQAIPCCVVQPRNVHELSKAVKILNTAFNKQPLGRPEGIFAVRGGGHSPVPGASSIDGGVAIDLSLLCDIEVSADRSRVNIGGGAKWGHVYQVLQEEMGLTVVGGRNSDVGVGGLSLGGGISFYSSRYGLVCSNMISYEVVLASGSIVTASETENPDLWRALKGGSNNFGIVSCFTARAFPATNIWSGFIYIPSFEAANVIAAFYDFVHGAHPSNTGTKYDDHAAGPIACFSYIHAIRMQILSVNLVYTKPSENERQWPTCWKSSRFSSLWRFWSTCEVRTLSNATNEMHALNPPGRRQTFATTTVKNDLATLSAVHAAYQDAIILLKHQGVSGLVWTLVLQPFLPDWVRKGDPNPLGLHDCGDTPLVNVSFTVNWDKEQDDQFVKTTLRETIERTDSYALAHGTGHSYRYLNYCAEWQNPFASYGQENWEFLKQTSNKYDPGGLFQKGCAGGFKLGISNKWV